MITKDQIEASLREIIARRKAAFLDKVPEGWVTAKESAQIAGLSVPTMQRYLCEAFKKNEVTRKKFRVSVGTRSPMVVLHYFLGKKPK